MRRSAGVSCSSAGFCSASLAARVRRRMRNDDSVGLMYSPPAATARTQSTISVVALSFRT